MTAPRGGLELQILTGQPLPSGWSGKLWALDQGLRAVSTPYMLLLDADIELQPGMASALLAKAASEAAGKNGAIPWRTEPALGSASLSGVV